MPVAARGAGAVPPPTVGGGAPCPGPPPWGNANYMSHDESQAGYCVWWRVATARPLQCTVYLAIARPMQHTHSQSSLGSSAQKKIQFEVSTYISGMTLVGHRCYLWHKKQSLLWIFQHKTALNIKEKRTIKYFTAPIKTQY